MSWLFEWKFLGFIGLAFSKDWAHYLNGIDGVYTGFFGWIVVISIIFALIFYFAPTAKISGKWFWSLIINAILNFIIGCWRASSVGNGFEGELLAADMLRTGFRFFVISMIIYFILSLVLKKFSTQNRNVPF